MNNQQKPGAKTIVDSLLEDSKTAEKWWDRSTEEAHKRVLEKIGQTPENVEAMAGLEEFSYLPLTIQHQVKSSLNTILIDGHEYTSTISQRVATEMVKTEELSSKEINDTEYVQDRIDVWEELGLE